MLRDVTADIGSVAYLTLAVERLWAGTYQGGGLRREWEGRVSPSLELHYLFGLPGPRDPESSQKP